MWKICLCDGRKDGGSVKYGIWSFLLVLRQKLRNIAGTQKKNEEYYAAYAVEPIAHFHAVR